ncbi:TatD family hydrolase [Oscillospiraceae bacterium MB08-C2-2]|nr:TatD family hydrolase [Oscillospiraceae bacterium MB08-C2-2]
MNHIFDSHAHYDDSRFDPDREELLAGLPEKGVAYIMNAGTNLETSRIGCDFAARYDFIYSSAGIHPQPAGDAPAGWEQALREMVGESPKIKALGEMGLDYHYDFSPREMQREVFEKQLILSKELDLPVIIHDREAHGDTMELLRRHRPKGIVHCYSGSAEMVRELVKMELYIGFTGVVTFKNARKTVEAAAAVPLERLLVETDCPYMAPEPYRGKRCDSSMIAQTAQALAAIKGISAQELLDATCENARRVYGI